jgi:8-oxo-dGTP pyrophosphatase MutT (NUDIX family)
MGGKKEKNEISIETAIRELYEETNGKLFTTYKISLT